MKKQVTKYLNNGSVLVVNLRFDDRCGNGHDTFSITADLYDRDRNNRDDWVLNANGKRRWLGACGCLHDEIREHAPELAHLIDWHLVSSDGPMHYVANTIYWAEQGNLEYARQTACWPDATLAQLGDKQALMGRLDDVLQRFNQVMEETFGGIKNERLG